MRKAIDISLLAKTHDSYSNFCNQNSSRFGTTELSTFVPVQKHKTGSYGVSATSTIISDHKSRLAPILNNPRFIIPTLFNNIELRNRLMLANFTSFL